MRNFYLLLLMTIVLFSSCEKNDSKPENGNGYAMLKTGNYWIYNLTKIDSLGVETITENYDSAYISGEIVIRGHKYFKMQHSYWSLTTPSEWFRDSSDYLVNSVGDIVFSSKNFNDTLHKSFNIAIGLNGIDTTYTCYYMMADKDLLTTVPAGNFSTLNYKGTYVVNERYHDYNSPLTSNFYYAKGVGLVCVKNTYMDGSQILKKLVRYKVN